MSVIPRVAVVTFATTHEDNPFKDYEKEIERLRGSALQFGLDFYVYTLHDLKKAMIHSPFMGYTYFRKGVGGWFWKPIVILHFLEKIQCDYLLYLDVDCILLKDPLLVVQRFENQFDIAGFRMDAQIKNWTTRRIVNNFQANDCDDAAMWTAGILLVKNSDESKRSLKHWLDSMSKPWNLFDLPFESDGVKHRHDQSVLSILIAKGEMQLLNLGEGFYSEGIEATSNSIEDAWVATGVNLGNPLANSQLSFAMTVRRAIQHRVSKLSKITFWISYSFIRLFAFGKNKR
jgi:hypothetical protein